MSDPLTYEGNIDFVTLSLLSASSSTRTMLCQTVAAGQTGNDNDAERFAEVKAGVDAAMPACRRCRRGPACPGRVVAKLPQQPQARGIRDGRVAGIGGALRGVGGGRHGVSA